MTPPKEMQKFLDLKFNELQGEIAALKDFVKKDNDSKFDKLKEQISTLQEENKKMAEKLGEVENDVFKLQLTVEGNFREVTAEVNAAQSNLMIIETILYNNCIKIMNVPEMEYCNAREVVKKILDILEFELKDSEIRNIFRYQNFSFAYHREPKIIAVEFFNTDVKTKFLERCEEYFSKNKLHRTMLGFNDCFGAVDVKIEKYKYW